MWMGGPQGQHCDLMTEALMCLKFRVMIRELRSHKVLRGKMFQSKLSKGHVGKEIFRLKENRI